MLQSLTSSVQNKKTAVTDTKTCECISCLQCQIDDTNTRIDDLSTSITTECVITDSATASTVNATTVDTTNLTTSTASISGTVTAALVDTTCACSDYLDVACTANIDTLNVGTIDASCVCTNGINVSCLSTSCVNTTNACIGCLCVSNSFTTQDINASGSITSNSLNSNTITGTCSDICTGNFGTINTDTIGATTVTSNAISSNSISSNTVITCALNASEAVIANLKSSSTKANGTITLPNLQTESSWVTLYLPAYRNYYMQMSFTWADTENAIAISGTTDTALIQATQGDLTAIKEIGFVDGGGTYLQIRADSELSYMLFYDSDNYDESYITAELNTTPTVDYSYVPSKLRFYLFRGYETQTTEMVIPTNVQIYSLTADEQTYEKTTTDELQINERIYLPTTWDETGGMITCSHGIDNQYVGACDTGYTDGSGCAIINTTWKTPVDTTTGCLSDSTCLITERAVSTYTGETEDGCYPISHLNANTCVHGTITANIVCGTTCVETPLAKATTCVETPIACATTCIYTPLACVTNVKATDIDTTTIDATTGNITTVNATTGNITTVNATDVNTANVTATTKVTAPIVCGTTCVQSPIVCGTTCVCTPIGNITTVNSTTGNITTVNSTTGNITTVNSTDVNATDTITTCDLCATNNVNITNNATIGGDTVIDGDLYVNGTSHIVDEETLEVQGDILTVRANNSTSLTSGQVAGININKYNGTDSLTLATDNTGTLRVGTGEGTDTTYTNIAYNADDNKWYNYNSSTSTYTVMTTQPSGTMTAWEGKTVDAPYTRYDTVTFTVVDVTSLEPILTRDEESNMEDGYATVWDATNSKAITNDTTNTHNLTINGCANATGNITSACTVKGADICGTSTVCAPNITASTCLKGNNTCVTKLVVSTNATILGCTTAVGCVIASNDIDVCGTACATIGCYRTCVFSPLYCGDRAAICKICGCTCIDTPIGNITTVNSTTGNITTVNATTVNATDVNTTNVTSTGCITGVDATVETLEATTSITTPIVNATTCVDTPTVNATDVNATCVTASTCMHTCDLCTDGNTTISGDLYVCGDTVIEGELAASKLGTTATSCNACYYPTFVSNNNTTTGSEYFWTNSDIKVNPANGTLYANSFITNCGCKAIVSRTNMAATELGLTAGCCYSLAEIVQAITNCCGSSATQYNFLYSNACNVIICETGDCSYNAVFTKLDNVSLNASWQKTHWIATIDDGSEYHIFGTTNATTTPIWNTSYKRVGIKPTDSSTACCVALTSMNCGSSYVYTSCACPLTFTPSTGILCTPVVWGSSRIIAGTPTNCTSTVAGSSGSYYGAGSIEAYAPTPYIDFHHNYSCEDFSSRIIQNSQGNLGIVVTNATGCNAATTSSTFNFCSNGNFITCAMNNTCYNKAINSGTNYSCCYYLIYERTVNQSYYDKPVHIRGDIGNYGIPVKAIMDLTVDFRGNTPVMRGTVCGNSNGTCIIPTWDSNTCTARIYWYSGTTCYNGIWFDINCSQYIPSSFTAYSSMSGTASDNFANLINKSYVGTASSDNNFPLLFTTCCSTPTSGNYTIYEDGNNGILYNPSTNTLSTSCIVAPVINTGIIKTSCCCQVGFTPSSSDQTVYLLISTVTPSQQAGTNEVTLSFGDAGIVDNVNIKIQSSNGACQGPYVKVSTGLPFDSRFGLQEIFVTCTGSTWNCKNEVWAKLKTYGTCKLFSNLYSEKIQSNWATCMTYTTTAPTNTCIFCECVNCRGEWTNSCTTYLGNSCIISSSCDSLNVGTKNTVSTLCQATAMGVCNCACCNYSVAVGRCNAATGNVATAIGNFNISSADNSSAIGRANTASGICSSAVGYTNTASASYSTALGFSNTASCIGSTATGYCNTASGSGSVAVGYCNTSSGCYSSAFGRVNCATGFASAAFGNGATASGANSSAFGFSNTASCTNATAVGYCNTASGECSVALGHCNTASGLFSSAVGFGNATIGQSSAAFGFINCACGSQSSAFGSLNISSTDYDSTFGRNNKASGGCSTAMGYNNTASGANSIATGYCNTVSGCLSAAVGVCNTASALGTTAVGRLNCACGVGSSAFGNSNTASGAGSSAFGLNNIASGAYTTAVGYTNTASGACTNAIGYCNTASGAVGQAFGYYNTASGACASAYGISNTASGCHSSVVGYGNTASGECSLAVGRGNCACGNCATAVGRTNSSNNTVASTFGSNNTNCGAYSTVVGYNNSIACCLSQNNGIFGSNNTICTGCCNIYIFGCSNTVDGDNVILIGKDNTTINAESTILGTCNCSYSLGDVLVGCNNCGYSGHAFGKNNCAYNNATAVGCKNNSSGDTSLAVGYKNTASGVCSTAVGYCNTASGGYSTATGHTNTSSGVNSTAVGRINCASGTYSTAVGFNNTASGEMAIAIGKCATSCLTGSLAIGNDASSGWCCGVVWSTINTMDEGILGRHGLINLTIPSCAYYCDILKGLRYIVTYVVNANRCTCTWTTGENQILPIGRMHVNGTWWDAGGTTDGVCLWQPGLHGFGYVNEQMYINIGNTACSTLSVYDLLYTCGCGVRFNSWDWSGSYSSTSRWVCGLQLLVSY